MSGRVAPVVSLAEKIAVADVLLVQVLLGLKHCLEKHLQPHTLLGQLAKEYLWAVCGATVQDVKRSMTGCRSENHQAHEGFSGCLTVKTLLL